MIGITNKTKSIVLTASGAVGTLGKAGYLHSITLMHAGAAAVGTVNVYDGVGATGTEKWRLYIPNTATISTTINGLNIYCARGIYAVISNGIVTVEYSGCV
jgi:hypothetical protein